MNINIYFSKIYFTIYLRKSIFYQCLFCNFLYIFKYINNEYNHLKKYLAFHIFQENTFTNVTFEEKKYLLSIPPTLAFVGYTVRLEMCLLAPEIYLKYIYILILFKIYSGQKKLRFYFFCLNGCF